MDVGRRFLRATTALPLILTALGGMVGSTPAFATCVTTGSVTDCGTTSPNPYTTTVGTGRLDNDRTVTVATGAAIRVTNRNAISLGDNARITLAAGSLVRGDSTSGSGLFGTGPQPIEFNSNGILVVGAGAQVISRGTQNQAEAVNVHGFGNRIENHGLISGQASAAIWFEDQSTGAKNVVDNFGTIEQINGGTVIGTSGGSGIDFYNRTGAAVEGSLQFAAGDDDLYFFAGSTVTGSIDGGAGSNTLVLEGGLGTADTLAGALTNFQTLTKSGLGRWTITGTLTGFQSTTVDLGTLALTGDNTGYAAGVLINPLGTLEARAQSLPTQTDPAANLDTIRNNGRLRFNQPDDGTYVGQIVGSGVVEKTGAGITTLAPSAAAGNTYTGGTEIADGTLAVAADTALGAASGGLTFFGGTLRTTATFATSRPVVIGGAGGTFEPTAATTLTEDGVVGGPGRLTKIGTGTLALAATNTYAGGTQIDAGTVAVAADANLGATAGGLGMDGGTLRSTASFATGRATTLSAGGGTFETQAGTLAHAGTIAGPGGLTKTGTGTLGLDGANTYSGGTAIDAGIVAVAADANLGAAAGTLTFGGGTLRSTATMAMDRTTTMAAGVGTFAVAPGTTLTQAGAIGGPGAMAKTGSGRMILTGDATHAGGTTIGAGRLQVGDGGTSGTLGGNVVDHGVLAFDRADALDVAGIVSGSGRVVQTGPGATRLTGANTYAGTTTVEDGALYVNGDQGGATGATTAEGGTTLGGAGTIGGDVTIADGATLAPGDVGATPGTLTVNGDLLLGAGALLDYSFGQANVAGGALNDRTVVGGGLVLDGTLDVTVSPGGSFDPGVYRVFDYAGTLTDNGLAIGTIPSPDFYVQTSVAAQVNLVNTTGLTLNFWDGEAGPKDDGVVDGGDGTWQSAAGNDNWTEATGLANAPFSDGSFAVFQGAAGTVTVDGSLGDVTVEGMQFATDGYVVRGDAIALSAAPQSIVRVGDGSAAGAGMTATIASALAGAAQLAKTDLGTLVLEGANTYAGGTAITGGVVEVAGDANLGAAAGEVALDDGTLRTTATFASARDAVLGSGGGTIETAAGTLTMTGTVSGAGALAKAGTGTLVLTGTNTYGGGTAIDGGTVVASGDATLGAAAGGLSLDGGTLSPSASFAMDRDTTLGAGGGTIAIGSGFTLAQAGDVAGAGALTKTGAGTLVLTGDGTATGGTTIAAGTLQLGDGGTTGSLAGAIVDDGVLVLDRSNAFEIAGPISGGGSVVQAGDGTTTLTGANGYAGGTAITGGTLSVAADANLGAAAGALAIDGGTLATTASFATARATTLGAGGGVIDTTAGTLGHSGTIGGAGALVKAGAGTLVLSGANAYGGATTVTGGTLVVDGDQSAATGTTTAGAGTTLAGSGTIGGDVAIADGATLAPGSVGGVPGTLAIAGDLALSGGARLAYSFGAANAIGGEFNDLTMVGGDLVLDGTLDVATTPGGSFDPGIYRVISYGGTLTDNGLAIGTIPSPQFFVQTSIANQVNLVNTTGLTLTYWDGAAGPKDDGVVNGGDGTWQTSAGNDNWTEATGAVNAPWTDAAFAIFSGAAGTVAVDASLGAVSAAGMQFTSDGYRVEGDPLTLAGTEAIVRVGDGTAAGAGVTATIAAALGGASALVKADLGTLVLEGANTYTGGTVIAGGVVEIAADANLGDATGELGFDGGTLRAAADVSLARATTLDAGGGTLETGAGITLTQAGATAGDGGLTKAGAGTVVMIGDATHTGGTTIAAGTLRIGDGGTAGSVVGDVANEGTLVFDRSDAIAFDGTVSGGGVLRQAGDGVTTLSAANTYGGGTEITGGTLSVAGDASLGAAAGPLAIDGGTLRTTAGFATDRATTLGAGGGTIETAAGTLGHAGTIGGSGGLAKVGAGTLVLSGANAYAGSTTVAAGALFVDGDQRAAHGATTAAAGATLGGSGRLGGDVAIADGATLAPGSAGSAPGTLSVAGGLALSGGALLDYSFGAANVVGGALNDLTDVAGDLVLDGTLDVVTAAGGSFDPGVYRVIRYGGALTDNGLAIGAIPSPDFFVQTSLAGQVNLVNTAGLTLTFWDGAAGPKNDGVVDGGDGSWQSVAGNDNWTEIGGEDQCALGGRGLRRLRRDEGHRHDRRQPRGRHGDGDAVRHRRLPPRRGRDHAGGRARRRPPRRRRHRGRGGHDGDGRFGAGGGLAAGQDRPRRARAFGGEHLCRRHGDRRRRARDRRATPTSVPQARRSPSTPVRCG